MIDPDDIDDEDQHDGQEGDEGQDDDPGEEGREADDAHEGQEDDEGRRQEDEGQVARGGRGSNAVRVARERAQAAEARAQKVEEEQRQLRQEVERLRGVQQQETPEQEAARLALMTTDERVEYRLAKSERLHRAELQRMHFESADRADKAEFLAQAATDKFVAKYKDRVETFLMEARRGGSNVSRDRILTYLIGEDARKAANAGGAKEQRDTGRRNITRQQTRPGSGRSDQPAGNRRGGRSLEERLDGVEL